MFFNSPFRRFGSKIGPRVLVVVWLACCAGCDSSHNDDVAATSPLPLASSSASSPSPGTKALLTLSSASGFNGVTEGANVKVARSAQGLVLQALTTDPSIVLPRFAAPNGKGVSVHIRFVSPGATTLQVFYDTKKNGDSWDETRSIRKPTLKGENDITVNITDAEFGGGIRIDPGDLMGEYTIRLIELRP